MKTVEFCSLSPALTTFRADFESRGFFEKHKLGKLSEKELESPIQDVQKKETLKHLIFI